MGQVATWDPSEKGNLDRKLSVPLGRMVPGLCPLELKNETTDGGRYYKAGNSLKQSQAPTRGRGKSPTKFLFP